MTAAVPINPASQPFISTDAFALRAGEILRLRTDGVAEGDRIAFMCAPVPPMPGPHIATTSDGSPVEQFAVIAAQLVEGNWQWMNIAPCSKEYIGDILFDSGLERGRWYGAMVIHQRDR